MGECRPVVVVIKTRGKHDCHSSGRPSTQIHTRTTLVVVSLLDPSPPHSLAAAFPGFTRVPLVVSSCLCLPVERTGKRLSALWSSPLVQVKCCCTGIETVRTVRDGESRTATSTFTQLLISDKPNFQMLLYVHRDHIKDFQGRGA